MPTLKTEVFQALSQASEILTGLREEVKRDVKEALHEMKEESKEQGKKVFELQIWQAQIATYGKVMFAALGIFGAVCTAVIVDQVKTVSAQLSTIQLPRKP